MGNSTHKNAEVMPSAGEPVSVFDDQRGYATTILEGLIRAQNALLRAYALFPLRDIHALDEKPQAK
jgi:hypothetical protein